MAVVREMRCDSATVRIDDSCCRGISPEEAARRWAEVERVILEIDRRAGKTPSVACGDSLPGEGALR